MTILMFLFYWSTHPLVIHTPNSLVSTHDGLQDADGADASSAPGRGGGGIAAAGGGYRSEASEPVAGSCAGGA